MLAPLLVAAYFVLTLALANSGEAHLTADLAGPLLIGAGVAFVAWSLASRLTRNRSKATVLATLTVFVFGVFGYFVKIVAEYAKVDQWVVAPWILLALVSALLLATIAVRRSRRGFDIGAQFVLTLFALLTAYTGIRFAIEQFNGPREMLSVTTRESPPEPAHTRFPDVYLIVLDKYTGTPALASEYGFDNTPFEDSLRHLGFYIPRTPRANYVHTFLALAAMLNFQYLDELPQQVSRDEWSRRPLDPMIESNRLMADLSAHGYRTVFFPSSYPSTRRNRRADMQVPSPQSVRSEFLAGWLWTTPIPVIEEYICRLVGCGMSRVRYVPESADFIDWKLAQIERLAGDERPTFAFMHLMVPHEPFIYDAHCRHRVPYYPLAQEEAGGTEAKRAYIDQIRCLNRKLLHVVSVLRERSVKPPVILLQADHGNGAIGRDIPAYEATDPARRAERASVFAAYALPGAPIDQLPDGVTPINVIRFVLREYLGEDLPPLEDVTYWSSNQRPYQFVRMPAESMVTRGLGGM
jgi:hypothetical protein